MNVWIPKYVMRTARSLDEWMAQMLWNHSVSDGKIDGKTVRTYTWNENKLVNTAPGPELRSFPEMYFQDLVDWLTLRTAAGTERDKAPSWGAGWNRMYDGAAWCVSIMKKRRIVSWCLMYRVYSFCLICCEDCLKALDPFALSPSRIICGFTEAEEICFFSSLQEWTAILFPSSRWIKLITCPLKSPDFLDAWSIMVHIWHCHSKHTALTTFHSWTELWTCYRCDSAKRPSWQSQARNHLRCTFNHSIICDLIIA